MTVLNRLKVVEAIKSRGTHFGFDSPRTLSRHGSTKKPSEFNTKSKINAHIYENSGLHTIPDVKFNSNDNSNNYN